MSVIFFWLEFGYPSTPYISSCYLSIESNLSWPFFRFFFFLLAPCDCSLSQVCIHVCLFFFCLLSFLLPSSSISSLFYIHGRILLSAPTMKAPISHLLLLLFSDFVHGTPSDDDLPTNLPQTGKGSICIYDSVRNGKRPTRTRSSALLRA